MSPGIPATFLLAVAALRGLQPRQYEPARTSWIIFEWMTTHLTGTHAAIMFSRIAPDRVPAGHSDVAAKLAAKRVAAL
jgi:hypothetical protein